MRKTKRKRYTGAFKAKVGMEALMGVNTVGQIAREYEVHPVQVTQWKGVIRERLPELIHYNTVDLPATNLRLKQQCLVILDEFPAIGRVNILAQAVGFMAGYNLRLLPIIQSLSQLESVYGEKDARTFVTNHACQILFAPREQRDAQHYSQMLGTYTAEAISTGTSRPLGWGNGKQASSSATRSEQARPLLLPQEVKELGDQRAIINLVHTKPILCDKARFYAEPVFIDRCLALPDNRSG